MPASDLCETLARQTSAALDAGRYDALQDMISQAPLVGEHQVLDLCLLCGEEVPARTWDATALAVTAQVQWRLTLLAGGGAEVYRAEHDERIFYGSVTQPAATSGPCTFAVLEDLRCPVALIALGTATGGAQRLVRVSLDVRRYPPSLFPIIRGLRAVVTGSAVRPDQGAPGKVLQFRSRAS